nr:DEAD/DEAH box helicase [Angustibacter aerolatus]
MSVSVRSGDTPAAERRAFARTPSDVLITTPESLFLLLTSRARERLAGVETVILDEVHAVAGTKRGAHLALTLERLDALLEKPAQRVGLSATVRPVDEVARFLAGGRPVSIVQPTSTKQFDLRVVVPVPDLGAIGEPTDDLSGPAAGDPQRASIWPHVEERVVDLVSQHRSTLVFANSRRLAERLTARLNEVWEERLAGPADGGESGDGAVVDLSAAPAPGPAPATAPTRAPAQVMAQAGASTGAPSVLARAHHGSVSREQRSLIEEDLKAGRLPAVVATRLARARHRHGRGRPGRAGRVPAQRGLGPAARRSRRAPGRRRLARGAVPQVPGRPGADGGRRRADAGGRHRGAAGAGQPLDVLAQQVVAMVAMDEWTVDDLQRLVQRAAPFAALPRTVLEAVLDMLAGRYPSEEFAEPAAAAGLGPPRRRAHRAAGRPATRRHQRRHHPRPRPVRRLPRDRRGTRAARRRASTRRWSTSRASATCSPSARRRGASRTSRTTGCSSRRLPGCPASAVLARRRPRAPGRAWDGPSGRSCARWSASASPTRGRGCPRRGSTSGPPTTCSPTSASSARPPGTCPTTAR